jgi:hypothetical protein
MVKQVTQQGRSEKRRGVLRLYVEPLIDARTKLETCFTIPC